MVRYPSNLRSRIDPLEKEPQQPGAGLHLVSLPGLLAEAIMIAQNAFRLLFYGSGLQR